MSTETALLAAVLARPDEDTPRLAYADGLDDHADSLAGRDPKEARARAEFIRLQIACEGRDDDPDLADARDRAAVLQKHYGDLWNPKLQSTRELKWGFHRGFAERPILQSTDFVRRADELFSVAPVRWGHFGLTLEDADALVRCPFLPRLRGLQLHDASDRPAARRFLHAPQLAGVRTLRYLPGQSDPLPLVEALAASEPLAGIESVEFGQYRLTEAAAVALARSPHLRPRRLTGTYSQLNNAGVLALAASPLLARLEELRLWQCAYGTEGAKALVESPHLGPLRHLSIGMNSIACEGIVALANNPRLAALRVLRLQSVGLKRLGIDALARTQVVRNLRALVLDHNQLVPSYAATLAASDALTGLRELSMHTCSFRDAGAAHLASSPHLHEVRRLNVGHCAFTDAGAKALAEGTAFRALTHLNMEENKIGDAGAAALAAGYFPELRHLTLAQCGIGDTGAIALAGSPLLASVEVLDIHSNRIGDTGAKALMESPHVGRVRELRVERNKMSRSVRAALEKRFNKPAE